MLQVDHLIAKLLSQKWVDLFEQTTKQFVDLENVKYPGVYILAYTDKNLVNASIDLQDIFYVGMSNSDGGVKQGLINFVSDIEKNKNHSGGMRFYRDYMGGCLSRNSLNQAKTDSLLRLFQLSVKREKQFEQQKI